MSYFPSTGETISTPIDNSYSFQTLMAAFPCLSRKPCFIVGDLDIRLDPLPLTTSGSTLTLSALVVCLSKNNQD